MVTSFHVGTNKKNLRYNCHVSAISPIPKSYTTAIRDPKWQRVMLDEFNALIKNNTWILVSRPTDMNIIRSMWLFKHKYFADGSLSRYKARLVANWNNQQIGIDYEETFSLVVKPATIRTVLSLATSRCDASLFIYKQGPDVAYSLLYMDDIFLTTSSTSFPQRIITSLHQEFSMTHLGQLNYFLGICHTFHQRDVHMLEKSNLGADGTPVFDLKFYKSLVRALHYLTFTRPELSYAVQQIYLHMHDLREPHLAALKRILRCRTTRCLTSGNCVFLGNNLLSWSSKQQHTLSRSSVEVEYRVANAVAETSWLQNFLRELHSPLNSATIVYCDNLSAVYVEKCGQMIE
ncbi:ribonuclease H-like domain-containing protein [Tanacetum coccineum]